MMTIGLYGSIQHVLFSRISVPRLMQRALPRAGFSFGLGAITPSANEAMNHLGELWTAPGVAAVLEADAPEHPTVVQEPTAVLQTPFNVHLEGVDEQPVASLSPDGASPARADALWRGWVQQARDAGDRAALFGAVYVTRIHSLRGSWVKQNPVLDHAPSGGRRINDPAEHANWFGVNPDGGAEGQLALVVGVAMDLEAPGLAKLGGRDSDIFYRNPGSHGEEGGLMIHQHALLVEGGALPEPGVPLADMAAAILASGTAVDVKHVLDDSLLQGAVGVFGPAHDIRYRGGQA